MNRALEKELQAWAEEMGCFWLLSGDNFHVNPRRYHFRVGRYRDDGEDGKLVFPGGPCDLLTDFLQLEHWLLRYDNGEHDTLEERPFPPVLHMSFVNRFISQHVPIECQQGHCDCEMGVCPYEQAKSGAWAWWGPRMDLIPESEKLNEKRLAILVRHILPSKSGRRLLRYLLTSEGGRS